LAAGQRCEFVRDGACSAESGLELQVDSLVAVRQHGSAVHKLAIDGDVPWRRVDARRAGTVRPGGTADRVLVMERGLIVEDAPPPT